MGTYLKPRDTGSPGRVTCTDWSFNTSANDTLSPSENLVFLRLQNLLNGKACSKWSWQGQLRLLLGHTQPQPRAGRGLGKVGGCLSDSWGRISLPETNPHLPQLIPDAGMGQPASFLGNHVLLGKPEPRGPGHPTTPQPPAPCA